jgi:hypothetical protein
MPEADSAVRKWEGKRPLLARRHTARVLELLARLPDRGVSEAVRRAIPLTRWHAGRKLATLARALKALDPTAPATDYHPAVGVWHDVSQPAVGFTPAEAVARFDREYAAAKTAPGSALAADAARFAGDVARAVCGFLSRMGRAAFLSCRTRAGWCGVSKSTAARLRQLVAAGVLVVVTRPGPDPVRRQATTYAPGPLFAAEGSCDQPAPPPPPPLSSPPGPPERSRPRRRHRTRARGR